MRPWLLCRNLVVSHPDQQQCLTTVVLAALGRTAGIRKRDLKTKPLNVQMNWAIRTEFRPICQFDAPGVVLIPVIVMMVIHPGDGASIVLMGVITAPFVRMPNRRRYHARRHDRGGQQQTQRRLRYAAMHRRSDSCRQRQDGNYS
jgi:hypothetical protein